MFDTDTNCPCGSNKPYRVCCQPFHSNIKSPLTAVDLMRSRFTAYTMRNENYLLETWDLTNRPQEVDFSKEDVLWTKLEVLKIKKGREKDNKGIVEFKAYYMKENEEYAMIEISRFKKTAGRWLYQDGLVKSIAKVGEQTNQGKNAPCACGSGKKFKRCCGK